MKKEQPKKDKNDTEEVCEIIEDEDKNKKTFFRKCGLLPKKHAKKKELKENDKQLRNVLIGLGVVSIAFIAFFWIAESIDNFEHRGIEFDIVQDRYLTFYHTVSKIVQGDGTILNYNIWLRKDPRKIYDAVEFDGGLSIRNVLVLNVSNDFSCDGDGVIAIENLKRLVEATEIGVLKDAEASCDDNNQYTLLQIKSGQETRIEQTAPSCYEMTIKECEILDGTERFIQEILYAINRIN